MTAPVVGVPRDGTVQLQPPLEPLSLPPAASPEPLLTGVVLPVAPMAFPVLAPVPVIAPDAGLVFCALLPPLLNAALPELLV
jgi:hypothetical protein